MTEAFIVGQSFSNWLKDTAAGFILTVTEVQPAGFWLKERIVPDSSIDKSPSGCLTSLQYHFNGTVISIKITPYTMFVIHWVL